jgi:hypothetical protein
MLPDIRHDKFVIDLLHMFIQIGQVLIDLIIDKIEYKDKYSSQTIKFNRSHHPETAKFADFLHSECKRNKIEEGSEFKEVRNSLKQNLTGQALRIIFQKVSDTLNQTTHNNILGTDYKNDFELWKKFWEIDILLRSDVDYTPEYLENKTKEFHSLFTSMYHLSKITPYIHFFCFHLSESYKNFGNLDYYSAQGFEKLNDLSTFQFFGGTNKHKDFIKQMLEKDFRIAFLEEKFDEGFSKQKHKKKIMDLILERRRKNSELPVVKFTKNLPNGEILETEKKLGTDNEGYFCWAIRSEKLKKIKYKPISGAIIIQN